MSSASAAFKYAVATTSPAFASPSVTSSPESLSAELVIKTIIVVSNPLALISSKFISAISWPALTS